MPISICAWEWSPSSSGTCSTFASPIPARQHRARPEARSGMLKSGVAPSDSRPTSRSNGSQSRYSRIGAMELVNFHPRRDAGGLLRDFGCRQHHYIAVYRGNRSLGAVQQGCRCVDGSACNFGRAQSTPLLRPARRRRLASRVPAATGSAGGPGEFPVTTFQQQKLRLFWSALSQRNFGEVATQNGTHRWHLNF